MTKRKPITEKVKALVNEIIPHEYTVDINWVQEKITELELHKIGHGLSMGGLDLTLTEQAEISRQFGRTRLCFRNLFSYTSSLSATCIYEYAHVKLAEPLLERINRGEVVSFALTEPHGGSSLSKIKSSWYVDNNQAYLTGEKSLIGNAKHASKFLILARGEDSQLTMFAVDANDVKVSEPLEKMGQEGIDVSNIKFMMAKGTVIGGVGNGAEVAKKTLIRSRVLISAAAIGMAGRAIEETIKYATDRKTIKHQLIQGMLADSYTDLFASKSMLHQVTSQILPHNMIREIELNASALKLHSAQMVNRVLDNCVQIMGGQGVIRGHIVEEFYRDARAFRIFEGTDEMQKLTICTALRMRDG